MAKPFATLRAVGTALQAAGKIELRQQVLDLQQTMLDAIAENTQLAADNNRLTRDLDDARKELRELQDRLKVREDLTLDGAAYYRMQGGRRAAGPFCPRCYVKDDEVAPMTNRHNGYMLCVVCENAIAGTDIGR